jgi:hypothetical protein
MIAGFTVVRNGIENGYPFIEAVRSALPLCDEVHVSEGFSTDGSFEALQRAFGGEPKVHLRRDAWGPQGGEGAPIRDALNRVRWDLRPEILFQFDANEILPPEDVPILRELPELYPRREIFALPYRQFMGRYWFNEEFRFRLVRNLPTVQVLWDGWTLGFHLRPTDLLRPKQFWRIAGRTALAVLQDRVKVDLPEQYEYLPRPIYRYYGLFPECFFGKMQTKAWLQDNPSYRALAGEDSEAQRLIAQYRLDHDYDTFWRSTLDLHRRTLARGGRMNKEFPFSRFIGDADHPALVHPLLGLPRYSP